MNLRFKKPKERVVALDALSVRKEVKSQLNTTVNKQTKLAQKKKIIVYEKESKKYVSHFTAYALGLIKTRAVMMDEPRLVELNPVVHNKLVSNPDIEIEYQKIDKDKKAKINVYRDSSSNLWIDTSAAYSLGYLDDEEFYFCEDPFYKIDEEKLENLKENFDVQLCAKSLASKIKR